VRVTDDRRGFAVELGAKEADGEGDAEKVECVTGPSQPTGGTIKGYTGVIIVKRRARQGLP